MEKSVSQLQKKKKKISKDLLFYEEWYSHVGTFIKYTVMRIAQHTTHNTLCLAKCVVRFRENKIMMLKKSCKSE